VALVVPLVSFACLFPLVENMPTWDQWHLVELWSAHYEGRPVLPLLLKPYNGHMNLVPRLLFYGMGVLSHWDVRLDIVASYITACGTLALLLRMLARRGAQGLLLAAPASAQVFCFLQNENFLSGYPLGQNLSQLFSTLTIYLLTLPRLGTAVFLGAVASTLAATFSWGAGLAGWYVGLVALLLRPDRSVRRTGVWLVLTLLATVAVKVGAGGSFGAVAWKQVPLFFSVLLGGAATPLPFPSVRLAIYLGAALLLLFGILAVWTWRRFCPEGLPWLLLGLSALASAGLIALGRAITGLQQALASHYVTATYPLVLACAVLAFFLLWGAAGHARLRIAWQALALAVVAVPLLQSAAASYRALPVLRGWSETIHRNAVAIARGTATDQDIRTSHHPEPSLVRGGIAIMREHQLSWFHQMDEEGPPWGRVERLAGQTVDPESATVAIDEPWQVEGWAVRSREHGGEVKGVYLFLDGQRIASAQLDLPRRDVAEYFGSSRFLPSGWLISVPPSAVPEGIHRLWIAAADYNDGLFTLLEARLVARRAAAGEVKAERRTGTR